MGRTICTVGPAYNYRYVKKKSKDRLRNPAFKVMWDHATYPSTFLTYLYWVQEYRAEKKSWYVVARNFFLLLLNFSAWPCLGAA